MYFHSRLAWNYRRLAELYLIKIEYDKSIFNLNLAFEHAKLYDTLPKSSQYTSLFVSKCNFNKENVYNNYKESECELLYYRMTRHGTFKELENEPEFISLKNEILNLIKESR
nr:hypothetical protein [uncultured Niameybacter sp.]